MNFHFSLVNKDILLHDNNLCDWLAYNRKSVFDLWLNVSRLWNVAWRHTVLPGSNMSEWPWKNVTYNFTSRFSQNYVLLKQNRFIEFLILLSVEFTSFQQSFSTRSYHVQYNLFTNVWFHLSINNQHNPMLPVLLQHFKFAKDKKSNYYVSLIDVWMITSGTADSINISN